MASSYPVAQASIIPMPHCFGGYEQRSFLDRIEEESLNEDDMQHDFSHHEEDVMYDDSTLEYYFRPDESEQDQDLNGSSEQKESVITTRTASGLYATQNVSNQTVSTGKTIRPTRALSNLLRTLPPSSTSSYTFQYDVTDPVPHARKEWETRPQNLMNLPTPDDTWTDELSSSSTIPVQTPPEMDPRYSTIIEAAVDVDSETHTFASSTAALSHHEQPVETEHHDEQTEISGASFPIPHIRSPAIVENADCERDLDSSVSGSSSSEDGSIEHIDWEVDLIESYKQLLHSSILNASQTNVALENTQSLEESIQEALRDHPNLVSSIFSSGLDSLMNANVEHKNSLSPKTVIETLPYSQLRRSMSVGHRHEETTNTHIKSRETTNRSSKKRHGYIWPNETKIATSIDGFATMTRSHPKTRSVVSQPLFPLAHVGLDTMKEEVLFDALIDLWRLTRGLSPRPIPLPISGSSSSSFIRDAKQADKRISFTHRLSTLNSSHTHTEKKQTNRNSTWTKCKKLFRFSSHSTPSLTISPPLESPEARYLRLKQDLKTIPFASIHTRIDSCLDQTGTPSSSLRDMDSVLLPTRQQLFGLYLDIVIADLSWHSFCKKYSLEHVLC